MSLFQLTYKDYIRKFKASKKKDDLEKSDLSQIIYFKENIININLLSEPIKKKFWYKKCFDFDHNYTLDVFNIDLQDKETQHDCFHELYGIDGWISSCRYNSNVIITSDWLTGYFIAKALIRVRDEPTNWFYYGCAQTQLSLGLIKHLDTSINNFKQYGADSDIITLNEMNDITIFNGITQTGNINKVDVVKSICNQLLEIDKLSFYISDVNFKNMPMLYNSILIALKSVKPKGFSFIRLPNLNTWQSITTEFVSFLLFVKSYFKIVKIFKTPWGTHPKYYLILSDMLNFSHINFTSIIKYIKTACNHNRPLYSKKYNFDKLDSELRQIYKTALTNYMHFTTANANAWFL